MCRLLGMKKQQQQFRESDVSLAWYEKKTTIPRIRCVACLVRKKKQFRESDVSLAWYEKKKQFRESGVSLAWYEKKNNSENQMCRLLGMKKNSNNSENQVCRLLGMKKKKTIPRIRCVACLV